MLSAVMGGRRKQDHTDRSDVRDQRSATTHTAGVISQGGRGLFTTLPRHRSVFTISVGVKRKRNGFDGYFFPAWC